MFPVLILKFQKNGIVFDPIGARIDGVFDTVEQKFVVFESLVLVQSKIGIIQIGNGGKGLVVSFDCSTRISRENFRV